MSNIFQTIRGAVTGTGGPEDCGNPHAGCDQGGEKAGIEVAEAGVDTGVGKRMREGEDRENSLENKRRRTSQDHYGRLAGSFKTPATAKPIVFSHNGRVSNTQKTGALAARGGFKPVNNLHAAPHAATHAMSGRPTRGTLHAQKITKLGTLRSSNGQAGSGRTVTHELDFQGSLGSNVPETQYKCSARGSDGFSNGPATKKRRTAYPPATNGTCSNPVDFTDGDSEEMLLLKAPVMAINGSAITQPRSMQPPAHKWKVKHVEAENYFGGNDKFDKMNKMLTTHEPRSRKSKDSSQGSERSPSVASLQNSQHAACQGSKLAPVHLDASDGSQTKQLERRSIPQSDAKLNGSSRPDINLTRDWPGSAQTRTRPGSSAGSEGSASGVRHGNGIRRPSAERIEQRGKWNQHKAERQVLHAEISPRLGNTFVRHKNPQQGPREMGRVAAMQVDLRAPATKASSMDDSLESIDPLHGATTIPSEAKRSVSSSISNADAARLASPSILRPTQFEITRPAKGKKREAVDFSDETNEDDLDDLTMPVSAFYASSYCVSSGAERASLVYDSENKQLELHVDGQLARLVGKDEAVSLNASNVGEIVHSTASSRVYVKGSSSGVSNGSMCIAFADHNAVNWFMRMTSDFQPTTIHRPLDRLNKTFDAQATALKRAYDAKVAAAPLQLYADESNSPIGRDDDERIHYDVEDDARAPKASRRKGMLGADSEGIPSQQRGQTLANEVQSRYFVDDPPRRSARERKRVIERLRTPTPERWTQTNGIPAWHKPVEYPAEGARRVTVDANDLECLDEGQFLNDNIITFGIRKIEEEMDAKYKKDVHFFNSFFYTSLTTKNGKKSFNYDAVKRWTKNKDIFSLPYVVVPINVNLHWIVAIICNLDKMSRKPVGVAEEEGGEEEQEEREVSHAVEIAKAEQADDSPELNGKSAKREELPEETESMKRLSVSDGESASKDGEVFNFGDDGKVGDRSDEEMDTNATTNQPYSASTKKGKGKRKSAPAPRKYDADTPAIILLDSFANPHAAETRHLKQYIVAEGMDKRSLDVDIDQLQGINAKGIPQQTNFCDCGVFLIGYVEEFSKDPRGFVDKIMSRRMDREREFAAFSAKEKRDEIRGQLLQLYEVQEEARRKARVAKAAGGKAGQSVAGRQGGEKVAAAVSAPAPASVPALDVPEPAREAYKTIGKQAEVVATTALPPKIASWAPVKTTTVPAGNPAASTPGSPTTTAYLKADVPHAREPNDGDDELESAPARALPPSQPRHEFNGSLSSADDDDMLDTSHTSSGIPQLDGATADPEPEITEALEKALDAWESRPSGSASTPPT
ncbi:hypothetical protein LTR62_000547 [Meristemomyces frigidus]|uniref:Ubiquitin-like protease family profile domain-containing protein n=1 Tax=Meristemomyces frigidus TaxID=1508187 RepID=A0AAN7TKE4_9PEZI|nr:hypothetical protein LTR62_000547 [Meristemomyces frigidus]